MPVSVLAAEITTITEELPLMDRGLFSCRNEGLSYLFDLSSIEYHYVNICKLKRNWKPLCSAVEANCVLRSFSRCAFSFPKQNYANDLAWASGFRSMTKLCCC